MKKSQQDWDKFCVASVSNGTASKENLSQFRVVKPCNVAVLFSIDYIESSKPKKQIISSRFSFKRLTCPDTLSESICSHVGCNGQNPCQKYTKMTIKIIGKLTDESEPIWLLLLYSDKVNAGLPSPASDYVQNRIDLNLLLKSRCLVKK